MHTGPGRQFRKTEGTAQIKSAAGLGCGGCIGLCPVTAIALIPDAVIVPEEHCAKCGIGINIFPVCACSAI